MTIYRVLKTKKACDSCKKFSFPENMKQLNGLFFCNNQECSNLHQSRTSVIQSIINKFQQTRVSFQDLYQAGGLAFIDLFEINNCQCEHPGMTLQDYTNHIQTCLKTRPEIESFKNEMLRIIEIAAPERAQLTSQVNPNPIVANPSPTPPSSPSSTTISSNSSLINESSNSSSSNPSSLPVSSSPHSESSNSISSPSPEQDQNQVSTKSELPSQSPSGSEKPNESLSNQLNPSPSNSGFNSEQSQPENSNKNSPLNHSDNYTENDKTFSISDEGSTIQKEQVIQQIQAELKNLPSIDLKTFNDGQYQN
jgi:hypothetical protein